MNKLTSLITTFCVAISLPALAQMPSKPFYIGADVGGIRASYNSDTEDSQKKNFFVGNINAGWQFHDLFSMELGYFRTNNGSKTTDGLKIGHTWSGVTFDVIANLLIVDRFSLLGSAGLAYVKMDTDLDGNILGFNINEDGSDDTTALKMGVGFQYKLSDSLNARTKVDFLGVNDGLWMYTAGIQYHL